MPFFNQITENRFPIIFVGVTRSVVSQMGVTCRVDEDYRLVQLLLAPFKDKLKQGGDRY
jgi:hypothetical protein